MWKGTKVIFAYQCLHKQMKVLSTTIRNLVSISPFRYGDDDNDDDKCKNCCFLPLLIIIILDYIIIVQRFTAGNSYSNHGQGYGPTDTRLISFSKYFCQSLSLEATYSGTNEYNISFYMLSTNPGLFAQENISIPEKIIVAKVAHHFLFYMHSGSEVTVSAYFIDSAWILTRFYLVKGINAYDGVYARRSFRSTVAEFVISNDCRNGSESLSHLIQESDFYYLIFRSDPIGLTMIHINVSMFIHLTQYSPYNNTITSSCSLSTSSNTSTTCSLPVSLYTDRYALLTVQPVSTSNCGSTCSLSVHLSSNNYALLTVQPISPDVDWLDEISLETHCVPRLWVYIVLLILLTMVLISGSIFYHHKKQFCWNLKRFWRNLISTGRIKLVYDAEFTTIAAKFEHAWDKGNAPKVKDVFVIKHTKNRMRRWNRYMLSQCRLHRKPEVYYHGTRLSCNIRESISLCNIKKCSICRISDSGFDPLKIRTHISFQRFGPGFYLAPNTSKCHDYTRGAYGYRALLLCYVHSGNKYIVEETDRDLRGPPKGYHSIYGKAGKSLNYDEIVVPESEAILPRYIIVYQRDE